MRRKLRGVLKKVLIGFLLNVHRAQLPEHGVEDHKEPGSDQQAREPVAARFLLFPYPGSHVSASASMSVELWCAANPGLIFA